MSGEEALRRSTRTLPAVGVERKKEKRDTPEEYWLLATQEPELVRGVENMCTTREGFVGNHTVHFKYAKDGGELKDLSPDAKLFVHCHSAGNGRFLCTDPRGNERREAHDVAEFLDEHAKLNKQHKSLTIFACYSNFHIPKLYKAMIARGYEAIEISGYEGECALTSAKRGKVGAFSLTAGLYEQKDIDIAHGTGARGATLPLDKFDAAQHRATVDSKEAVTQLELKNAGLVKKHGFLKMQWLKDPLPPRKLGGGGIGSPSRPAQDPRSLALSDAELRPARSALEIDTREERKRVVLPRV